MSDYVLTDSEPSSLDRLDNICSFEEVQTSISTLRVKIIEKETTQELEDSINEFVRINKYIKIKDIKYSKLSALIIYKTSFADVEIK